MPRVYTEDPLQGFNFRISIPGLPKAVGFKKISGLSKEIGVVEYDEGGYNSTHKLKGKLKTGELVCEKGMFANTQIEDIFKQSVTNKSARLTITVELLNKDGKVARKWTVLEAWCNKWEAGELDASSEDPVVETLTFQYEDIL